MMEDILKTLRDQYPNHTITISLLLNGAYEVKAFEKDAKSITVGLGETLQEALNDMRNKTIV
jgi:hypothetical protein